MIFFDQRVKPVSLELANFSTKIDGDTGSHATFVMNYNISDRVVSVTGPQDSCKLFAEFRLPNSHFFDSFEMESLFPNQTKLYGEQDLEAPQWSTSGWGSVLHITLPLLTSKVPVSVPFHARYMEPNKQGNHHHTKLFAPHMFMACSQEDASFTDNPWDQYTSKQVLFGPRQTFHYIEALGETQYTVRSPVGRTDDAAAVMWLTVISVFVSFLYVTKKLMDKF